MSDELLGSVLAAVLFRGGGRFHVYLPLPGRKPGGTPRVISSDRSAARVRLSRFSRPTGPVCTLLKGDRAGQWSVRVSGNWRVVFRFEDGEAVGVDLIDYH